MHCELSFVPRAFKGYTEDYGLICVRCYLTLMGYFGLINMYDVSSQGRTLDRYVIFHIRVGQGLPRRAPLMNTRLQKLLLILTIILPTE